MEVIKTKNPKGAGRKPNPDKKIPYATKLRPYIIDWLRSRKNASREIEIALEKHIKKKE